LIDAKRLLFTMGVRIMKTRWFDWAAAVAVVLALGAWAGADVSEDVPKVALAR
jgi:hypothetical protein